MNYEFKFPDIGEGMTEGELSRWLVEEGQRVAEDQPVAEVQTDKVQAEISAPVSGTVKELMAAEGDTVFVGSTFVTFELPGGEDARPEENGSEKNAGDGDSGGNRRRPVRATPAVRRVARELGVDLTVVEGSGSAGRVLEEDVRGFAARTREMPQGLPESGEQFVPEDPVAKEPVAEEPAAAAPLRDGEDGRERRVPIRGVRRAMFRSMSRSAATVAPCTTFEEADITELVALRARIKAAAEERGVRLTYLPFIVKAAVTALGEHPELNASYDGEREELVLHDRYDVGIATDTPGGLVAPVVRDTDDKSVLDLAREVAGLAERAREGRLGVDETRGATFTVTSMGPVGGIFATPIITPPQVAILGAHRIQRRPVVADDEIVVRDIMGLSLTFDHRLVDGATASYFFRHVISYLEQPNLLLVELS